ncbi:MAG: hypothetical protein IKV94_05875 [Clostridia bacterium]|nr:hypothetical protein [Clostridia bacterium]
MGLFDRFKKNKSEHSQVYEQQKMPLSLQYSDGTRAEVNFMGLTEVDVNEVKKQLHQVNVVYISSDGKFISKPYLLEPIPYRNEKGEIVDGTEMYYKQMGALPQQGEDKSRYNAVKGFFKQQFCEVLESNYIGNLAQMENGEYRRNYDNQFKSAYDAIYKQEQNRKAMEKYNDNMEREAQMERYRNEKLEEGFRQQLQGQIISPEYDVYNPKSGDEGILTPQQKEDYYQNR